MTEFTKPRFTVPVTDYRARHRQGGCPKCGGELLAEADTLHKMQRLWCRKCNVVVRKRKT